MSRIARLALLLLAPACRTADKGTDTGPAGGDDDALVDRDGDGYTAAEDCDDGDAGVHPGATEICDGVDNDCDDELDEGVLDTWYADADGDGYGDPGAPSAACDAPAGHVATATDCDDGDAEIHPAAAERCNEVDDDCDGQVDEDVQGTWYADADEDGHGDAAAPLSACDPPAGWVASDDDCDDTHAEAFPGAAEVCDELDNDCDGETDEDVTTTWWADTDGDGYGDPATTVEACALPSGFADEAGDCDDGAAAVNPGATELCNAIDDDCDGTIDEADAADAATWYGDSDADGYGDASSATPACAQPAGTVADATDCDDAAAAVNPGATEVCNSIDDDCDGDIDDDDASVDLSTGGTWYADRDADGYGDPGSAALACLQPSGTVGDASDCDDGTAAVSPAATEVCNSIDDDCDGDIDDDDGSLDTATGGTWYADADADGYGDASSPTAACLQPTGTVTNTGDCDDTEALAWTGAAEVCDGVDNDCDGDVDGGVCLDISNVDPSLLDEATTALTVSASGTIDTDTGAISGLRAAGTGDVSGIWFEVVTQASGPDLGVFVVDGLTIASGVTLTVQGGNGLVILSGGDVDIAGTLDADGDAGTHGQTTSGPRAGGAGTAGGADGGAGSNSSASGATAGGGTGGGGTATAGVHYGNGGGGAGHCYGGGGGMGDRPSRAGAAGTRTGGGAGGYGGGDGGRGGNGGGVSGSATLEPLLAGSGGAGGVSDTDHNPNGSGGGGGGGGGAVQLSVDGTLTVSGTLSADGGSGGDAYGGGGGGASGGSVLLEALVLDLSGTVSAAGGAGGDGNLAWAPSSATGGSAGGVSSLGGGGGGVESGGGGGGSGWIHLRYLSSLSTTGSFTPALGTDCGSSAGM